MMVGVNPVTAYNPNPALYAQPQQVAYGQQQPFYQQPAQQAPVDSSNDLARELAGANALAVEGTTQVAPQIMALAQQTAQINEMNKAQQQLQQQKLVLQAQIQANAMKGQQTTAQGQALQQLQGTMPTITAQQPTATATSNGGFSQKQLSAMQSGNLGEFGKATTENLLSGYKDILKVGEDAKKEKVYAQALVAQGIPQEQANALAKQKIQTDNAAMAGQTVVAQQPAVMVQQQPQVVQQAPAVAPTQPVVQSQPVAQQSPQVVTQASASPATEEMVNVPRVGLVPKSTLTALLQNTTKEAQEAQAQAQQQALQQQAQPTRQTLPTTAITPRKTLDETVVSAVPMNLQPTSPALPFAPQQQQSLASLPVVASPLAFASVNSFGNSGINANNYQQMLAYANQQQQPTATATTATEAKEDSYAEAKKKAAALGFDTTKMPNNREELRRIQRKRHKRVMAQMLKKPKLYVPKPDDSKYAAYGGGDQA